MTTNPNELIVGYGEADGLTKREYFAAIAMQGLLAGETLVDEDDPLRLRPVQEWAAAAVTHADALIAALNREGQADG